MKVSLDSHHSMAMPEFPPELNFYSSEAETTLSNNVRIAHSYQERIWKNV